MSKVYKVAPRRKMICGLPLVPEMEAIIVTKGTLPDKRDLQEAYSRLYGSDYAWFNFVVSDFNIITLD